ncbi:hypothetical protein AMAG_15670 [Allomyces macrogynus ATCC 38327]|uniref:Uncharacterized protein n=1 Tax=Allomyces macrogynus (strain ATCC 38327) TaxID=578462 RepID=A0A0L0T9N0_ALLM3|nr:hypothetical protein AMAG_15670 [Allomyces macrogynus ATCC 38327]|eukprot:KNE71436.1 hypothetical protein AMAG_15670 [Allomyces macrogynus ATCC 38327]
MPFDACRASHHQSSDMNSIQLEAFLSWAFVPVDDDHFRETPTRLAAFRQRVDSPTISTNEDGVQQGNHAAPGNDFSNQAANDSGIALLRLIHACSSNSTANPPANDPLLWTRPDDEDDAGPAALYLAAPPGHLLTGPIVVMSNARHVEYSVAGEGHVPTTGTGVTELPFEYQSTLTAVWCAPADEDGSWWQRVAVPVESPVRAVRLKFVSLPRDEKDIFILRYISVPEPTAAAPPAARLATGSAGAAMALLSSMMGGVGGGPAMPGPAPMMAMLAARMQGVALGGGVPSAPLPMPSPPAAVVPEAVAPPPAVAVPAAEPATVDPQPGAAEPGLVDQLAPVLAAIARMEANLTAKLDRVVEEVGGLNRRLEVVERAVLGAARVDEMPSGSE